MLKPPVALDKLMEEWVSDSKYDETEIGKELLKISSYHSKYKNIMTHHSLIAKKLNSDFLKHKKIKWEYYRGELNNPTDLQTYGLPPWTGSNLRQDITLYLDSDDRLNELLLKKAVHDEIVDYCASVLKELNNRTWQLKSYLDFEKLIMGS